MIGWTERAVNMAEMKKACNILVGKCRERTPLGSPRRRWIGEKQGAKMNGFSWLSMRSSGGLL